jgi:hypothetical protein
MRANLAAPARMHDHAERREKAEEWPAWTIRALGFVANALARRSRLGFVQMSVFKSAVALLALACFPGYAAAEDAVKGSATQVAIEKAKGCDDNVATAFSQLNNETAEEVAKAAFEKCFRLWFVANNVYFATSSKDNLPFAADDVAKHPELTGPYFKAVMEDSKKNSIEAWKAVEIDRLRLIVMDARLKNAPTR